MPADTTHTCSYSCERPECIRAQRDELAARLTAAQQPAAHPAITHCGNCGCDWLDNGLNPVGCPYCKQSDDAKILVAERDALEAENERLREQLRLATVDQAAAEALACSDAVRAAYFDESRRADKLADALAGLITWIPSAATYRRLGFDPDAPMRALAKARAALAKWGQP